MVWLEFLISAGILIYAGTKLTVYADLLSDRFALSKVWIGVMLLAFVTSLPEAGTSLAAVVSLGANDLAVGNMLGSNNINLMIIVFMDLMYRRGSVTNMIKTSRAHLWSAVLSVFLSLVVLAELFWGSRGRLLSVGHLSLGGFLIAVIYLNGIRFLAGMKGGETPTVSRLPLAAPARGVSSRAIAVRLIVSSALVIASAVWLAKSGDDIARVTGLGETFVGSVFLALSTSLPEIVVSLSAVRIASFDLAFGNIFGSNMINMFILFICDLFYLDGNLLGTVSPVNMLTVLLTLWLTAVVIAGVRLDKKKAVLGLGWDSILLIASFLVGVRFLYHFR